MAHFEKVSRFKDLSIALPQRGTTEAAGYDLFVAEETIIPPYKELLHNMEISGNEYGTIYTLEQMKQLTKTTGCKPTLVSIGMKCQLEPHTYLKIVPRSSTPLKYWLVIVNGEGIIDADYFNNPQNEGEIFLQLINLSPFPIKLQVGDCIAQGIICNYGLTINDKPTAIREGGFGSTTK